MAIDPRISLAGQPLDVMSSLTQGLAAGENIRNMGVRDAILRQQQQLQQQTIQQNRQTQALQGMQTFGAALQGAMNVPDLAQRAKIWSQQIPALTELGIPESKLRSVDLSNEGLKNTLAQLQPFMKQQEQAAAESVPVAIQEFEYLTRIANDENQPQEVRDAARIKLGLEARAVGKAPGFTEIGGATFATGPRGELSVPEVPTTPDGQVSLAPEQAETLQQANQTLATQTEALTPEVQRSMQAEQAAAVTEAEGRARQELEETSPEAERERETEISQAQKTIQVVDSIINSDRLNNITGITGRIPFSTSKTSDLLSTVQQLDSLLTADNLDIMTGVLSESDIKIIRGLSNDISLIKDRDGEVTGIRGSYEGTIDKLKQIRREIVRGANKNGFYFEGQTVTNPDTGERLVYRNGEWVAQ